jgi:uncharacterized protein (TIGR03790 family)
MKMLLGLLVALLALLTPVPPALALLVGNEVVVVYNRKVPESEQVARHYAKARRIPENQIIGLDLGTNEVMSRAEYEGELAKPLAREFETRNFWRLGQRAWTSPSTKEPTEVRMPVESSIRYVVLCYGVPLKIENEPELEEKGRNEVREEFRVNHASVDSELATLPLPKEATFRFGLMQNQAYTTTNTASLSPTNGILMVTRLDGPTAKIAMGLVDKTIESETNGYWGRAYFDIRSVTDTNYVLGDQWIGSAFDICRVMGFESHLDTNAATFPASLPLSQMAFYAGWYEAGPSGPFLAPKLEFMPGAFAYHLHSASAWTVRSETNFWVGPLLAKGATCSMGSVYEPYLIGTPDVGTFAARWLITGFTFGEAAYASQNCLSWQTTVVGDPLYRAFAMQPQLLQLKLNATESPLRAWMLLRMVNLNQVRGVPPLQLAAFLENLPLAKQSAVLSEKLGDLNAASGKPASTLRNYERALELDPSPQQSIRLMLKVGDTLMAQKKYPEAAKHWLAMYRAFPDYPGKQDVAVKLALAESEAKKAPATNSPPTAISNSPANTNSSQ